MNMFGIIFEIQVVRKFCTLIYRDGLSDAYDDKILGRCPPDSLST